MLATFKAVGFDEVEKMLLQRSEDVERIAPEMIKAGAKVLIAAQKAELRRISRGDRSIGTLANSIGMGKIKKSVTGIYADVYPQGNQPHGTPREGQSGRVSNAQVGFVIEYGSSKMVARPWMSIANTKSEAAVHAAMRKVWEEKQDG